MLHFKLLLNIGKAISHLHDETQGGSNIWGKKNPQTRDCDRGVFSDIFSKEDAVNESVHGLKTSNWNYSFEEELKQTDMDIHRP